MSETELSADTATADLVLKFLCGPESVEKGGNDVTGVMPDMSYDQAYLAQFASKVLQAGANGPIIGYQASLTSEAAKKLAPPGMPTPYIGTLQLRNWCLPTAALPISPAYAYVIECETGMRLARALAGPGLTAADARKSVATVHAALEIVPIKPGLIGCTGQHMVAIHNFGSNVVFAEHGVPADVDLVNEPVELFFDGEPVVQAVAGDSGGDPFAVLAEIANILGRYGRRLEAGMVVMTGSATAPQRLTDGASRIEAQFGRLGSVNISLQRN